MNKPRVLTGIKPTNKLHIGNYLGCLKQFEQFSTKDYDVFLFVPDLHALTDDNNLKESIFTVMRVFLATCENDACFFIQSQHMEISYITWFLSCCTPIGHLQRMTQFKAKEHENINSGYLYYPILMAADILSIDSDIVPVGLDQKQHLEITRDICKYFKNKYKMDIFKLPKEIICETPKVMSLQDPFKKMSKSDININATIFLEDSADIINNKIKKAITDSECMPMHIAKIENTRPGIYNLCQIYRSISNISLNEIENQFGGGYISTFKASLIDILVNKLNKLQEKMSNISNEYINQIIDRDFNKIHDILTQKVDLIDSVCNIYKKKLKNF